MKLFKPYLLVGILAILLISGCQALNVNSESKEDVFDYQGALIGDNSSVLAIIHLLSHSESFKELHLQTKEEPFGMTLTYEGFNDSEYKETAVYNGVILFATVENAKWVAFEFEDQEYKITRDQASKLGNLENLGSEEEAKQLIEKSKTEVLLDR
ncbi:DUF4825 domain-containing protein [Halobacillus massiliensis]|uniref:DUF4825 domain-containing protein n=1 Tax=Halobacillus massiliensis TaxID=1926286 RepID=UPI0009E1D65E|nr:DUF4825 domain-containing protein [Halobacillus massiliensis]